MEVPSITKACVDTPFAVYLGMGLLAGALVTWLIWSVKPRPRFPCRSPAYWPLDFCSPCGRSCFLFRYRPLELIEELRRGNPVATGEQRDAADSRQANGQ